MRKWDHIVGVFLVAAGLILVAAGMERVLAAMVDSQILRLPDPVLGIGLRPAVLCVGAIGIIAGLACVFGKSISARVLVLAWITTSSGAYLGGLFYMGVAPRLSCLGSLTDPLHLSGAWIGGVLQFVAASIVVGACIAAVLNWIVCRRNAGGAFRKVACPGCGCHFEVPQDVACKIGCPHCGGGVRVQQLQEVA